MNNGFYFIVKALFVITVFKFFIDFLDHVEKRLDKKAKVNFKTMTSQTGWQTATINILPDISKTDGTQAIKFGQLVEYNVSNIFYEKVCRKWG